MTTGQQKRYFEFQDAKSAKFWEVTTDGTAVTVRYGKIGTNGQSQTKEFADDSAAAMHVAKLVAEKTGKGYVESGNSADSQVAIESVSEVAPDAPRKKAATARKTAVTNPAKDPEASPESLLSLLNQDDATNRLLARHPRASADLLEQLSHSSDKATRQAVCLNPNSSQEVLTRLAPQFPGDFFLNPAFDWLLLEDPDFLFKLGQGVLKNILKRPDCPASFMHWAIKHGSEAEQLALTMNPRTPEDIVKSLAQRSGAVGDAARGRTADGEIEDLASQEDLDGAYLAEVKKALSEVKPDEVLSACKRGMITGAQRSWLSLDCRILLADLPLSLVVIGAMKGHEHELSGFSHPEVRVWLAQFLEDNDDLFETLGGDSNYEIRAAVAANPNCPDGIFNSLIKDKNPNVRAAAALSIKISPEQASALAADTSPVVREAACKAWCVPFESLQALGHERSPAIKRSVLARLEMLGKPAGNPATNPEELSKIAETAKGDNKRLVAANPSTPLRWLQQYAGEGNAALDKALLENPRLPYDLANMVYLRVLETLGPLQRIKLLEQTKTPRAIRELAGQKAWESRFPKCKYWIHETHEFLCSPWTGQIENDLLKIPSGEESTYAGSMLRPARLLGLSHSRVPPELLIKRSNSVDWAERLAIARNTSLPPNLVAKFKKDPHKLVAAQAQATEKAKAQIKDHQEELLSRTTEPVDWSSIFELLQEEISRKEIRAWEWFGTPWWPHLSLKQRLGYYRVRQGYKVLEEVDLEGFFAASPYSPEHLAGSSKSEVREWLSNFKTAPLNFLEQMFASESNSAAQVNWLSRVRVADDPELPKKLRNAVTMIRESDDKWHRFQSELMHHPDMPLDALIELANAVDSVWKAKDYLRIATLPTEVRVILEEICRSMELDEISKWASDAKSDVRRSAAIHPHVPSNVLEKLVQDKNKEIRLLAEISFLGSLKGIDPVERSFKSQAILKSVLSQDIEFIKLICRLINCPTEILEELPNQKDIWSIAKELASNPSVPESVLLRLAKLSRKTKWPKNVHDEVMKNPSATRTVFQTLINSKSGETRATAAYSLKTPSDLLVGLEFDPDPCVRVAIAKREDTSPDIQALLARDSDVSVRHALAKRESLDMAVREQLAMDQEYDVRLAALYRGGFSQSFYNRFFDAGFRDLPVHCVKEISDERHLELLAGEVGNSGGMSTSSIKSMMQMRSSIPRSVFMTLAQIPELRREIAEHPDTPSELIEELAHDSDEFTAAGTLKNPMISESLMREVLDHLGYENCRKILGNPFAPHDLIDKVDRDGDLDRFWAKTWYEKKLVGAPVAQQVESFLTQAMKWAAHPKTPLDRLRSFAASGIWTIRWAVASNSSVHQDEARAILDALWVEVGEALFGPEPVPLSAESLGEDGIRNALERLDLMPQAQDRRAIAAAAKSPEVLRRVAAVLSPGIQPSVLKMLLEDPVESVKTLAAEKLRGMESHA